MEFFKIIIKLYMTIYVLKPSYIDFISHPEELFVKKTSYKGGAVNSIKTEL